MRFPKKKYLETEREREKICMLNIYKHNILYLLDIKIFLLMEELETRLSTK